MLSEVTGLIDYKPKNIQIYGHALDCISTGCSVQ